MIFGAKDAKTVRHGFERKKFKNAEKSADQTANNGQTKNRQKSPIFQGFRL